MGLSAAKMDSQQVEIVGRAQLTIHLAQDGIEIARPERDNGIDLVCYLNCGGTFLSAPLQIKVTRVPTFSVWKKYSRIPSLLMIYVWLDAEMPTILAMTQEEATDLVSEFGWDNTNSWMKEGHYRATTSKTQRERLEDFRVNPGDWIAILKRASAPQSSLEK